MSVNAHTESVTIVTASHRSFGALPVNMRVDIRRGHSLTMVQWNGYHCPNKALGRTVWDATQCRFCSSPNIKRIRAVIFYTGIVDTHSTDLMYAVLNSTSLIFSVFATASHSSHSPRS